MSDTDRIMREIAESSDAYDRAEVERQFAWRVLWDAMNASGARVTWQKQRDEYLKSVETASAARQRFFDLINRFAEKEEEQAR